jgi:hypothetical protein
MCLLLEKLSRFKLYNDYEINADCLLGFPYFFNPLKIDMSSVLMAVVQGVWHFEKYHDMWCAMFVHLLHSTVHPTEQFSVPNRTRCACHINANESCFIYRHYADYYHHREG